jgi:hypothetical protein
VIDGIGDRRRNRHRRQLAKPLRAQRTGFFIEFAYASKYFRRDCRSTEEQLGSLSGFTRA